MISDLFLTLLASSKLPSPLFLLLQVNEKAASPAAHGAPHLSYLDTGEAKAPPTARFQSDLFLRTAVAIKVTTPSLRVRPYTSSAITAAIMPRRSTQEWIRISMRTPGILIFGMVMSPCGWILDLVATVAPNWRTIHNIPNTPSDEFIQQGIWDICRATSTNTRAECNLQDSTYFGNQIIEVAQGLMVASLIVTLIGLAVAIPGVRCWKDNPNWTVAGLGGLLIFLSGVMTIIPIAWYTHILEEISTVTPTATVTVGYCIILGYIGGIFEILAGFVMFIGICRCCGGKNRGERRVDEITHFSHQKPPSRRVDVPSLNRARSTASSSVPYSKDSMDEDVSFPRAKSPAVNNSYNGTPYDADL